MSVTTHGATELPNAGATQATGSKTRIIDSADVLWVQARGDYSRLWSASGGRLARATMTALADAWKEADFIRIHRSYLVRASAITDARLSGQHPTVSLGATVLPVSRRMLPAVRARLRRTRETVARVTPQDPTTGE